MNYNCYEITNESILFAPFYLSQNKMWRIRNNKLTWEETPGKLKGIINIYQNDNEIFLVIKVTELDKNNQEIREVSIIENNEVFLQFAEKSDKSSGWRVLNYSSIEGKDIEDLQLYEELEELDDLIINDEIDYMKLLENREKIHRFEIRYR